MQATAKHTTADICRAYGNDRHRLLDILRDIQARDRWNSPDNADRSGRESRRDPGRRRRRGQFLCLPVSDPQGADHHPPL